MRLCVLLLLLTSSAAATSYLPSQEPFTPQELLDRSVARADAICIAHLDSVHTTEAGYWLSFRTQEILKGHPESTFSTLFRLTPASFETSLLDPDAVGHSFMLFLVTYKGQWVTQLGEYQWRGGVFQCDVSRSEPVSQIRESIKRGSVDSMTVQADLIALVNWDGRRMGRCQVNGTTRGCQVAGVDSVLSGRVQSDSVSIYGKLSDALKPGRSMTFLKSEGAGTYTVLAGGAGALLIHDGMVGGTGLSLNDYLQKLRTATKSRAIR